MLDAEAVADAVLYRGHASRRSVGIPNCSSEERWPEHVRRNACRRTTTARISCATTRASASGCTATATWWSSRSARISSNEAGIAFDFVDIKRHLRELADRLDHENLNDLPPFTEIEPSAENQARYFYEEMKRRLPDAMADGDAVREGVGDADAVGAVLGAADLVSAGQVQPCC